MSTVSLLGLVWYTTVNSEILARTLFLQIALKDMFATFRIHELGMNNLH